MNKGIWNYLRCESGQTLGKLWGNLERLRRLGCRYDDLPTTREGFQAGLEELLSQGRAEKGRKDSFWHTAWGSAAKKTVIRDMINRGLLPVSAEYREAVDRGLQHEDDGALDMSMMDMLPTAAIEDESRDSEETHDRPQTGEEVDGDLVSLATQCFMNATDGAGVDFEAETLIQEKQPNNATVDAIRSIQRDRKAALAAPKGGKTQKQLT